MVGPIIPTADAKKFFQGEVGKGSSQFTKAGQVGQGVENNPSQGIVTLKNSKGGELKCYHLSYGKPGTQDCFSAFWAWNEITPLKVEILAWGTHAKSNTGQPSRYKIQESWNDILTGIVETVKKKSE